MLPRVKYRNPSVPIEVNRHNDPDGPSLLHVYTKAVAAQQSQSPAETNAPPSATPNAQTTLVPDTSKPTHTIDIKDQHESEILDVLIRTIKPQVIEPTEQEKQEMQDAEEFRQRSDADRVIVREKLLKERREQELLKLARGEVPATN